MFDEKKRFVIDNYNRQTTFASFLPGISGIYGIPIWNFYVNRGQAITAFGAGDKDHAIMEFYPALQCYQRTKTMGFRTFLKVNGTYYEPFRGDDAETKMHIGMNELEIEETNEALGFAINVLYYTLPNEPLGGLCRTVTIKNLTGAPLSIELLDGAAAILPYGISNTSMKEVGTTIKAYMQVEDHETGLPYYRLPYSTADTAEVTEIKEGHYLISVDRDGNRLPLVVDSELTFGYDTAYDLPAGFLDLGVKGLLSAKQITSNQVPCGFACYEGELSDMLTIHTVIGQVNNKDILKEFAGKLNGAYFDQKYAESVDLIDKLSDDVGTVTANPVFDAYTRQNYVDNVLRGGYPIRLGKDKIFYVYSRKHGDIERDYNFFSMLPEYFSQGNGNFRDVNQNRRSDIYFNPFVGDFNIKLFYNLIQLDGYNPLHIKQITYRAKKDALAPVYALVPADAKDALASFFEKPFSPGQLFTYMREEGITPSVSNEEFINTVMDACDQLDNCDFADGGYWTDHWTYNLDLVDAYLKIFPEEKEKLFFDDKSYTYFESKATVLPRSKRYEKTKNGVRQYHFVDEDAKKDITYKQARTKYGKGEVYTSTLAAKLVLMSAVKFASLDMEGCGIEMDGGKPGWYDALNGLPGLFGSSVCETFETERMLLTLKDILSSYDRDVTIPKELSAFIGKLREILGGYKTGGDRFAMWNKLTAAKEAYREEIEFGVDGAEVTLSAGEIIPLLDAMIAYIEEGISILKSRHDGIVPSYCGYKMSDYKVEGDDIVPENFDREYIPLFLEGPVRYLKLPNALDEKKALYDKVKASALYDKKLSMYKVNESLKEATFELGRCRAFQPGWLENESIWLHMEYKYMLSTLKAGLFPEFFDDLKTAGVPFIPYETYGRSPLENSSFIVSSANGDEKIHGKGFVARLSGSTAEFIEIWELMMFGEKLFALEDGELALTFAPAIPAYLIPENGEVSATFLAKTTVTYHAGASKDLIPGKYDISKITVTYTDGATKEIAGGKITGEDAETVRAGKAAKIDVYLT